MSKFLEIIDVTALSHQHVVYLLLHATGSRSATPRIYTVERTSASSCAEAIACRRVVSAGGWWGWASSRWLSLVRRTASTSLGVGTPPRRSALDSETRKHDREVPRHEDKIPRANIRFRARED